jgi:hypothetical protein
MTLVDMDCDELNARVEKAIEKLSGNVVDAWILELEDNEDWDWFGDIAEEPTFKQAFWEAARVVFRDLIMHGHTQI